MVARSGDPDAEVSLTVPPLEYVDQLEIFRYHAVIASREAYRRQQAALLEPPGRDEYRMLKELHLAQEKPGFDGVLVGDLVQSNWERMYPEQENVPRKIFGGHSSAGRWNWRWCMPTHRPAAAGGRAGQPHQFPAAGADRRHAALLQSRGLHGRDLDRVEVEIERLSRDRETRALSNTCIFTFVNVDENLTPRPVPRYIHDHAEDERYLEAYRRRLRHLSHRRTDRVTSSIL